MSYYRVNAINNKHFFKPGEIVLHNGMEYRENGELYIMVQNVTGLKQLVKKSDLTPERIPERIEVLSEQLKNNFYESTF